MRTVRILLYTVTTLALAGVVTDGFETSVRAAPSRLQQDIFAVDCIETTIYTGTGITTEYGCPEPPTIETEAQLVSRSPMIFEGWFDAYNKQSLKITFSNGHEYVLGMDSQLTVSGDRWELRLVGAAHILPPGSYTMVVEMTATNGSVVLTSKQFIVDEYVEPEVPVDPTDPTRPIDPSNPDPDLDPDTDGGAGSVGSGSHGDSPRSSGGRSPGYFGNHGSSSMMPGSTENDDSSRIVSDATTSLVEQVRRVVISYATPSWLLTFLGSLAFFGYVFYLMGRHYRYIEEQHKIQLKALKRAARKTHRPVTSRHAADVRKKRHA